MIKERIPVAMFEVKDIVAKLKETEKSKEVNAFLDKFMETAKEKSKNVKRAIEELAIIKLRPIDVIKIVDMMPENAAELNKIFTEISLDADETNKILDTIKNNK